MRDEFIRIALPALEILAFCHIRTTEFILLIKVLKWATDNFFFIGNQHTQIQKKNFSYFKLNNITN